MKDKRKNHQCKVIPFPGLEQRYFEEGVSRIEAQDFQNAVDLLRKAQELNPENPQISAALLAALYENGDYEDSKQMARELLHKGIGNFYEILDIYLMILIQLNDHEQVVATLEPLFEENEVPMERADHFLTLLQLSRKSLANQTPFEQTSKQLEKNTVLDRSTVDQFIQIGSLEGKNIYPYLDLLLNMLSDHQTHPMLKTVVLNLMRENHVEQQVLVKKFDMENEFVPVQLPFVHELPFFKTILKELEKNLGNDNPVLLTQIKDMVHRHSMLLYPFEPQHVSIELWIGAYLGLGHDLYGENWNKEKMAKQFNAKTSDLEDVLSFLLMLEEISLPNV